MISHPPSSPPLSSSSSNGAEPEAAPDIFREEDYRSYLNNWFSWKKKLRPDYSKRNFARRVGSGNPSIFNHLTSDSPTVAMTDALLVAVCQEIWAGEQPEAEAYFRCLVALHQARETLLVRQAQLRALDEEAQAPGLRSDRVVALRARKVQAELALAESEQRLRQRETEREQLRNARRAREVDRDLRAFLGGWLNVTLLVMLELRAFKEDPVWIQEQLLPTVSIEKIEESLRLIESIGVASREGGHLAPTDLILRTPADVRDYDSSAYHRDMLKFVLKTLDNLPNMENNEQRRCRILGTTIAVSAEQLLRVQLVMVRAESEILAITAADPEHGPPRDRVFQLVQGLVPLTRA